MIIDLEGIANKLTVALYKDSPLGEVEKAKIEYGFSLTLGIGIALTLALILGAFLGTFFYTLLLILSALGLRLFSGGAHCSSYDRCLLFSLLVFVPAAVLVKFLALTLDPGILMRVYFALSLLTVAGLFPKSIKAALWALALNLAALAGSYLFRGAFVPWAMFSVSAGIFLQGLMLTKVGAWLVDKADRGMETVGI